ncbi:Transcription initiation factor IIA subunit 2 [Coemansia sp. S680]|nr:Transcription initiation factor IIA subunit 2 [Coemansia sp. S680]
MPREMRFVGDQYVRSEFRSHRSVSDRRFLEPFFAQWTSYLHLLQEQTGRNATDGSVEGGTLGAALIDSLNELIQAGHITPQLAMQVLGQYDKSISEALSSKVKAKVTMKGHLKTYNNCDDVWTLNVTNLSFKYDHETFTITDKVKIVACSNRRAGE